MLVDRNNIIILLLSNDSLQAYSDFLIAIEDDFHHGVYPEIIVWRNKYKLCVFKWKGHLILFYLNERWSLER